jgi:hypothetical protein
VTVSIKASFNLFDLYQTGEIELVPAICVGLIALTVFLLIQAG